MYMYFLPDDSRTSQKKLSVQPKATSKAFKSENRLKPQTANAETVLHKTNGQYFEPLYVKNTIDTVSLMLFPFRPGSTKNEAELCKTKK